ncbi:MAG: NAD(P)-dependent oxidoreductase, partial [Gemmataceae bacterium]
MSTNSFSPAGTRVGWIGTGVMGRWMAGHLQTAGATLTVYNRSPEKTEPLVAAGATLARTPKDVAAASDVVFAIVGFPSDVREVFLGPEGILAGAKPGTIIVDMTTSEPGLAITIDAAAAAQGLQSLDAPVTGGDVGAKNATLSIMVGGAADTLAAIHPLLSVMGKTIIHHGPAGAGQHAKIVNQILISSTMIAVCEGLLYAQQSGL